MNGFQIATLGIAVTTTLIMPVVIFLIRGAIKWTRVETKLDQAIARLEVIVRDKDDTHKQMLQQMTDDRKATDQRLRWLEQNVWLNRRAS